MKIKIYMRQNVSRLLELFGRRRPFTTDSAEKQMKVEFSAIIWLLARRRLACRELLLIPILLLVGCAATMPSPPKRIPTYECKTIEECVTYVRESVSNQWIRPDEFTHPSKVQLRVELNGKAVVQQVEVAASSGNVLFDRSAVEAVQRTSVFPALNGLDQTIFERTFKIFFFDFSPDTTLPGARADRVAYDTAFGLLKSGRYEEGAAAFSAFVEKYPTSPLIDYGFYWVGESCYVLKDYTRATAAFQTVLDKYPRSQKVPDSLLGLGDTNYKRGEYAAARRFLERLVNDFAGTELADLGVQRLMRMKGEGH